MLTVAACALVLTLGMVALLVTSAAQAGAAARSAADLGALAGATVLMDRLRGGQTSAEPCAAAAAVVERNGAVQESCLVDNGVNVTIRIRLDLTGPLSRLPRTPAVAATARAGPEAEPSGIR